MFSGLLRREDWFTDVSNDRKVFIFKVKQFKKSAWPLIVSVTIC
jgi:hypothetical protein